MFGKFGEMMGKLQEMKQKADEIKRALDEKLITKETENGKIRITISGSRKIKKIEISEEMQKRDTASLQDALVRALNAAIEEADSVNEAEMKKAAAGMLPGL